MKKFNPIKKKLAKVSKLILLLNYLYQQQQHSCKRDQQCRKRPPNLVTNRPLPPLSAINFPYYNKESCLMS